LPLRRRCPAGGKEERPAAGFCPSGKGTCRVFADSDGLSAAWSLPITEAMRLPLNAKGMPSGAGSRPREGTPRPLPAVRESQSPAPLAAGKDGFLPAKPKKGKKDQKKRLSSAACLPILFGSVRLLLILLAPLEKRVRDLVRLQFQIGVHRF